MSEELELEGKFLDAQTLGLTEDQRCGLVKTLAWLEAGKLDHENEAKIEKFDMGHWRLPTYTRTAAGFTECGTVCCIGGTAEVLMGMPKFKMSWGAPQELNSLFYPGQTGDGRDNPKHSGWQASTAQAAVALRGYLETGKTNWDAAMKTPRERSK
jgi:hypothetical protein